MVQLIKLIKKETIARDTVAFYFEKPNEFVFKPGQFAYLSFEQSLYNDQRGLRRHFSIASAPHENYLMFATRMRASAFKKTLGELSLCGEIKIDGPYGAFVLDEQFDGRLVFLTGGIGIAPFYSMIKHVLNQNLKQKILLFYSNREPQDAAFFKELTELSRIEENFKLFATMTDAQYSLESWDGLRGYIDRTMIEKHVSQWREVVYYIAGPPRMVNAMQDMLAQMDILSRNIKTESFTGY